MMLLRLAESGEAKMSLPATSEGTPLGKVFAGLDLRSGSSWTVTLSHKHLEMLTDPGSIGVHREWMGEGMRWKFVIQWRLTSWAT